MFADYEQVKAVKKCTANEPDELDLEEADVVLLLQKTTTGEQLTTTGEQLTTTGESLTTTVSNNLYSEQ